MNLHVRSFQILAMAMTLASPVHAQRDKYAPIVLQMPAGTRLTGLAGAFTGVRDIEVVLANPALVGIATGMEVSVERFRASTSRSVISAMSLGVIGVAVTAQAFDYTTPEISIGPSPDRPPVSSLVLNNRSTVAASSVSGGFALATAFKGFRWGAVIKYVEERIGATRDGSPALDLGITKDGGGRITTGLSVQNIGPGIDFGGQTTDLPLRFTLGMAGFGVPVGPFDFGASLALSVLRDGFVAPAAGMEWGYAPLEGYNFVVRAGLRRPELDQLRPLTFGATASLDRFALEYAFEDVRGGAGHRIGLRVR